MADIATPTTARKTEEFTPTQIDLVRNSLAIADSPILPDRTYIVFDATSGNNNLHLDTGGSSSYSILTGQGGLPINYTDTGGTKVLSYTNAGRYIITIIGTFNGVNTDGELQADKDRLIYVYGGTNYPTTIPNSAFEDCVNIEKVDFINVTSIGLDCFSGCDNIINANIPLLDTISTDSFDSCGKLENANYPLLATVSGLPASLFANCTSLRYVNLPLLTVINTTYFIGCENLETINFPLVTTVAATAFSNCIRLKNIHLPIATQVGGFNGCLSLKEVDLLLCTTLSNGAFQDCVELERANLPALTSLGTFAFSGCTGLKVLSVGPVVAIGATSFTNVVLTDLIVNGTEAQAIVIQDDIVTAGGFFNTNSRLIFGSEINQKIITNDLSIKNFISLKLEDITIASGVAVITNSYVSLNGEGGSADDLETITSSAPGGTIVILKKIASSGTITVVETGNIRLVGASRVLTIQLDRLMLQFDDINNNWMELAYTSF